MVIIQNAKRAASSFFKSYPCITPMTELPDPLSYAMFSLIKTSRSLLLPLDLQIELFEKLVKPVLSYDSEVWDLFYHMVVKCGASTLLRIFFLFFFAFV